ncbi:MAG: hypothetical protein PVJ55_05665, partial [Anaerolineae bacterium]
MGKKIIFGIAISLLVLAIVGCAAAPARQLLESEPPGAPMEMDSAGAEAPMEESEAGARGANYAATERLIIRNASL